MYAVSVLSLLAICSKSFDPFSKSTALARTLVHSKIHFLNDTIAAVLAHHHYVIHFVMPSLLRHRFTPSLLRHSYYYMINLCGYHYVIHSCRHNSVIPVMTMAFRFGVMTRLSHYFLQTFL
jgi:hypothetical protein